MHLTFVETQGFVILAVFCRIGSAIMILPAIGDMMVSVRFRLVFAVLTSFVLAPIVGPSYPPMPAELGPFTGLLFGEIVIGIALGSIIRMFLTALQVAGTVIASQTGLAFAQNFDPSQGIQGALLASFLTVLAMTVTLESDLHHLMLIGLRNTYNVLKPGAPIPWGDFADLATRTFSLVFRLGIQMSAPFIVFSLVFYAAAGVIARLLPQIQIFFISVPLNILAGFALFMVTIGTIMMLYLDSLGHMLTSDWL